MPTRARSGAIVLFAGVLLAALILPGLAAPPANEHFERSWARTDRPVADGQVVRTWMWGPEAFTGSLMEPYAEAPGGQREVQYFDKTRKEITTPDADPTSIWYVTNGLLVVELITGNLQLGHDTFEQHNPATVNVAGDSDDPNGPTYQTYAGLLDLPPHPQGSVITQRVSRDGTITDDPSLAVHSVTAAEHVDVPGINHRVASPFWAFMNSSGVVFENGTFATASLFENPYYATGLPITEAYWAEVQVAGTPQDVLTQCFERRCLTFNPLNEPAWQVEAGNVGQHYHHWRYVQIPGELEPTPTATVEVAPTATATVEPDPTPVTDYVLYSEFGGSAELLNMMEQPRGIAAGPDGSVYVTDLSHRHIQMFTANGVFVARWGSQGSDEGEFEVPIGVAVGNNGDVYVTDAFLQHVQRFSANGDFISAFGSYGTGPGEFETPWGIAAAPDGSIYVSSVDSSIIQKLTPDGQYILHWGDVGSDAGEFHIPYGIAVDSNGDVYITDHVNERVQKFDSEGNYLLHWGTGGSGNGQFLAPTGIAIGADGVVYVADSGNHRIQMFNSAGHYLGKWGQSGSDAGDIDMPDGIAAGSDGTIYVVEEGNTRVQAFTADGESLFYWSNDLRGRFAVATGFTVTPDGSVYIGDYFVQSIQKFTLEGPGQFDYAFDEIWKDLTDDVIPIHLASDQYGDIYVADDLGDTVRKYPLDENLLPSQWGAPGNGPGEFDRPLAVAIDDDGFVYVADLENHRIQKLTSTGQYLMQWGSFGTGPGQFNYPIGIAVTENLVYVADAENHRVQMFDTNGLYLGQWGSYGTGPSEFNFPHRVAIDSNGYVFITDTFNHRVQKFTADGEFITMFGTQGDGPDQMSNPMDIEVTDDGYVFVLESSNARIQIWGPAN